VFDSYSTQADNGKTEVGVITMKGEDQRICFLWNGGGISTPVMIG